ncbi:MAG: hypothetical protein VX252_17740 [Myxococcota bacterium]|nr:hypothetical protein [Myxococcota bacterium]
MIKRSISTPVLLLAVLSLGGLACAFGDIRPDDPMDRQFTLEEQHKHYSDLVRWSQFDKAATYIKPSERAEFVRKMPEFEEVRFTDWTAEPWEFEDPETLDRAVIAVTYRGYSMQNPFEVQIHEKQEWSRNGRANHWVVVSSFKDLGQLTGR